MILWLLTSIVTVFATLTFAGRTGALRNQVSRGETVGRFGIIFMLTGVTSGVLTRTTENAPFRWFHLVLLIGGVIATAGYVLMVRNGYHVTRDAPFHPRRKDSHG